MKGPETLSLLMRYAAILLMAGLTVYFFVNTVVIATFFFTGDGWTIPFFLFLPSATAGVSNETILSILALFLASGGIISWIFKELIRKELMSEALKLAKYERIASVAEQCIISTQMFGLLYELREDESYFKQAITLSKNAANKASELDDGLYKDVILKALNNRAFGICLKYKKGIRIPDFEVEYLKKARGELNDFLASHGKHKEITENTIKEFVKTCDTINQTLKEIDASEKRKNITQSNQKDK